MWPLHHHHACCLQAAANTGKKSMEYAFSTLLRGGRLNHGTWRVNDILRGVGALYSLGTHPIPVRGYQTILAQTAGMAVEEIYSTVEEIDFKGPGAFLELASRPYLLLNEDDQPLDISGNPTSLLSDKKMMLFHEVSVLLDHFQWQNDKLFIDYHGQFATLSQINSGAYGAGTSLMNKDGYPMCYHAFKESNAAAIFFAAGGNAPNASS